MDNRRYTLPVYIGRKHALLLFKLLYYVSFVDLIVLVLLGIHPVLVLLLLLTLIPLRRNIARFQQEQHKGTTFILSVKNFMLMSAARIIVLGIAVIWVSIWPA
jgi:1,4-dihydroxy-2-naphthoate octaprenyltransferase